MTSFSCGYTLAQMEDLLKTCKQSQHFNSFLLVQKVTGFSDSEEKVMHCEQAESTFALGDIRF